MSEGASILSPAGFVMDVNFVAPQPAVGPSIDAKNPFSVVPLLPGASVQARGHGVQAISQPGVRGTVEVSLTTGAPGGTRALCYLGLSDTLPPLLAVILDSDNLPTLVLFDALNNMIAQTVPTSPAIPEGTPLTVRFAWDSTRPVQGLRFASLSVNGIAIPDADWAGGIEPLAPWESFPLRRLWLGYDELGFPSFNGTLWKVQASTLVNP